LGTGAIGGLVRTAVASLGEDVTVLVRPEKLPGYPTNLSVERPSGAITAPAQAAATLTKPVDVLWIATKTYQLKTALRAVQSLPLCIVPLVNGVDHVEVLRAHFGRDRVLPAAIAVEAERVGPGRFVQRSPLVNSTLPPVESHSREQSSHQSLALSGELSQVDGLSWQTSPTMSGTVAATIGSTGEATCSAPGTVTVTASAPENLQVTVNNGVQNTSPTVTGTATLICQ
jgi:ketopantoate reductase